MVSTLLDARRVAPTDAVALIGIPSSPTRDFVRVFCNVETWTDLLRSVLQGGYHHPLMRTFQANGRTLNKSMLMYPIFISDDPDAEQIVETLPGQKRWGINKLAGFIGPLIKKGLKSVILFGVPMKMTKVCWIMWRVYAVLTSEGSTGKRCGRRVDASDSSAQAAGQRVPPAPARS